jgi:site-specific DNA-methyltransferase (cytosine-N4-specific)
LPQFFIKFLTEPGDKVVDIFAGSNTTGEVAESLGRRWLAIECDREYALASAFRFMGDWSDDRVAQFITAARGDVREPIEVTPVQASLF